MLETMRDLVKKYVEAGLGAIGSERAEELLEWSRKNTQRVVDLVRREVQRQLKLVGVATRDELSELKKRVRTLERQVGKPAGAPGAKKASSKKPAAKRSSSKTTG